MLAFRKCQKRKAQVKVSTYRKFRGLSDICKVLKQEIPRNDNRECMNENLHGIEAGRAPMPVQGKIPIHSLLNVLLAETLPVP